MVVIKEFEFKLGNKIPKMRKVKENFCEKFPN